MTIKFVQIETTSVCNQRCQFCPVSVEKRKKENLCLDDIQHILQQLDNTEVEKIYLNGFNEPTLDKEIIKKTALINQFKFPISFLSNGSGLNPELVKNLIANNVLEYTINLSTLDPIQYKEVRGNNDIIKALPNIDFLLEYGKKYNIKVEILILGRLDSTHAQNIQDIYQHFKSKLDIKNTISICPTVDYAADLTNIASEKLYHKKLSGCVSNRHTEWLHFTAAGNSILCCQDYQENYKTAHIHDEKIADIPNNQTAQQFYRWVEGIDEAPDDFICRNCIFALSEDNYQDRMKKLFCNTCQLPERLSPEINSCQHCVVSQK